MSSSISSVKASILAAINQLKPHDDIEEQHITDTRDWIKSDQQIFRISKPDNPNKHLVSYFIVLDETQKKILLADHKKSGLWLPTGGHVEVDEDPAETVRRECLEELNVTAKFWQEEPIFITKTITVGLTAGHTDVSLWYVIKGSEDLHYDYDKREFNEIAWFDFDSIPYEQSDPNMKRFITKLNGLLLKQNI